MKNFIITIIGTVIAGVIVAIIVGEGRFAPKFPAMQAPTENGSGSIQVATEVQATHASTATENLAPNPLGGGRIAFVSNRDGNSEIYVMNSDGSDQTRLTNNLTADDAPAWSSDSSKIAFVSNLMATLKSM